MSLKKDKFTQKNKYFMNLALNLASQHSGLTGNNPSVGCIIVKNDIVISTGHTSLNGRPHAEYNAIKNSKENLNGSTMYVTLEPCNHYGKTQPCTNLIIKSQLKEVIYSVEDVDQRTMNKSKKILKKENIIVRSGLLKKKVNIFYKNYYYNRIQKMPFVTGKIAISKNNLIYTKKQKRITNKYSDQLKNLLRYRNDSILISSKTLNIDNPRLNCRIYGLEKFSPKRIILDKSLNTNISSYIFKTVKKNNTIIFYNKGSHKKINAFIKKGVILVKHKLTKNDSFDLRSILKKLYYLNCRNLLVEGGKNLSIDFFNNKLFNQFYLFKSDRIIQKIYDYKEFNPLNYLSKNYKYRSKINTFLGEDTIYLYTN
jgi:diaminohydroxyphosphoribosylaminopyrimidine deaminase/5-amino-6-(5-phosphoribosylamino)uracil reductase